MNVKTMIRIRKVMASLLLCRFRGFALRSVFYVLGNAVSKGL